MKIVTWDKSGGGQMIRVTPEEALQLIQSLASQLLTKCINDRAEFFDQEGRYFSISVHHIPLQKEELVNDH